VRLLTYCPLQLFVSPDMRSSTRVGLLNDLIP
jgi:hypothetical protein